MTDTDMATCVAVFREAAESMEVDPERLASIIRDYGLEDLIDDAMACRCYQRRADKIAVSIETKRQGLFLAIEAAYDAKKREEVELVHQRG